MTKVAVFYLARKGNPERFSRAFLHGLVRWPSGADFDLYYLLKGYGENETDPSLSVFRPLIPQNIHEIRCSDETFATNVIIDAAAHVDHELMIFFTSSSRVLAGNWLRFYVDALERTNVGIVGATSGYEAIPGAPFPNVNVRHNACLLERRLFLDVDPGPLKTKLDGNLFEAGVASMTRQIMARGKVPVIVDRHGKVWEVEDWPRSLTFRSGHQEGLLVSDNRTYHYDVASPAKRLRLARLNWGDRAFAPPASLAARGAAALNWYFPRTPLSALRPKQ